MGRLIDDLLQLSKVTRSEMRREPVDLTVIVRRIAEDLREFNPGRTLEFVIEDGLKANGDPRLLRVALTNLLDNAVKFTGTRLASRIEFHSLRRRGRTAYCVRDNGVGFDEKYVETLFRPFQRLHKTSEFPGTGIGLATVQRVIRRHGGEVWAGGTLDNGAAFGFTLE